VAGGRQNMQQERRTFICIYSVGIKVVFKEK
jgi:hypothetical protein